MTQQVFDRRAVRLHRDRAAALLPGVADLLDDCAGRLLDRLDDIVAERRFGLALDVGGRGAVAKLLRARGIEVVSIDISAGMAAVNGGLAVAADEEWLPFAAGSFDLVVASVSLHWINDLPGALIQLRQALRPDGLLLASVPVLGTLQGLREALTKAEAEIAGGVAPRVSPFPDLRDCAGLLQRAGYALPVVDREDITLAYADALALLRELRAAGETNALLTRDKTVPSRALFGSALARMGASVAEGDRVEVALRLAMMTAWAPHAAQPRPLARGSGEVDLRDALR
jgi:NADH dehydrogenase [ubiquinone] 1 alpha subcomplex assembly factor 5